MKRKVHNARWFLLVLALFTLVLAIPALTSANHTPAKSTMPAVVMVLSVDTKNGQLVPMSGGSGTIVDANGSVLTNHHVLFDAKNNRLHDLFVIGLFRAIDQAPELVCAGSPARGMLKPELDLALIRCDRDRGGKPWQPSGWPTLPIRHSATNDINPGEPLRVLGYPATGGGSIHVTAGLASGWTGEHGGAGSRAFIKTDASISHGNSGGTAIDEDGNFIGVPTAFRLTSTKQGDAIVTAGRVGLIRPLEHAIDLLEHAKTWGRTGESQTDVIITGKIVGAHTGKPIAGATLVVFKTGLGEEDLEEDKLDEQALAWAETDAAGMLAVEGPISRGNSYTVAVTADGYLPVVETRGLVVPKDASPRFRAWRQINLQQR